MRVAELVARRRFQIADAPPPRPNPGEVLVRVGAVGVCGSDLHYFSEGSIGDTPCVYPMVLGHEPAGTVVEPGPGVTGWSAGDRAALEPAVYCYHCEWCMTGRHNVCANIRFLSMPGDPGFFREFVAIPAENLLPVPAELTLEEATLFEPLAVVAHSMKFVQLQPGEDVAVFGAGPIGLLTVFLLRVAGAKRIWALEPVPHRRELARAVGASAALDPSEALGQVRADTRGRGVDAAIDCAARGESMNAAIDITRNAGRIVVTGIPSDPRVALDFHTMRRKELALYNVRRSNHESEVALDLLKEYRAKLRPMLTHELPLEDVQRGFDLLERYADGVGKLILRPAAR